MPTKWTLPRSGMACEKSDLITRAAFESREGHLMRSTMRSAPSRAPTALVRAAMSAISGRFSSSGTSSAEPSPG